MSKKPLTLTIVIPAYNEERHLAECLDAIARQTVKPDEVIVVDNNSTDRTAEIARKYPFVKVLHESKQGFTPPRNRGFNAATGDIIGRINADAILVSNWVEHIKADFAADEKLGGVSGVSISELLPWRGIRSTLWARVYFALSDAYFRLPVLWGANMAIRRDVWLAVRADACPDDRLVHDDIDLSLLIAGHGWRLKHDDKARIRLDGRDYTHWPKFKEYVLRRISTKRYHDRRGTMQGVHVWYLPRWYRAAVWLLALVPALLGIIGILAIGSPGIIKRLLIKHK